MLRGKQKGLLIAVIAIAAVAIFGRYLAAHTKQRNVILIVMDTTRADHLGAYGYPRATTPNLDAFAKESTVFDHAVAAAPWTPPSIASIVTGLYPVTHGLMPKNNRSQARKKFQTLRPEVETLAETLSAHGYSTLGVSPNPWTSKTFGFDQGFDSYVFKNRVRANEITASAKKLVNFALSEKKPFFLFVHYLDAHSPYDPPEPYNTRFPAPVPPGVYKNYSPLMEKRIGLYDGEISFMDHEIGELFAHLKEKNVYDDSLIVILADHGEQFEEHAAREHGIGLFNEETHIPLMIRTGGKPRHVGSTVSNVDVYPTVLTDLGIPVPEIIQGIPLQDEARVLQRPGVLSEINGDFNLRSFVSQTQKKIIMSFGPEPHPTLGTPAIELTGAFDPKSDPAELHPLTDEKLIASLKANFEKSFRPLVDNTNAGAGANVKPELLEQLKSLGYMK